MFKTEIKVELINEYSESEKEEEEEENIKKECPEEAPYLIKESNQFSKNCSSYNFFKYYFYLYHNNKYIHYFQNMLK